jgi:hypothetical protein
MEECDVISVVTEFMVGWPFGLRFVGEARRVHIEVPFSGVVASLSIQLLTVNGSPLSPHDVTGMPR